MTDLCREFGISRKTGYKILYPFDEPRSLADVIAAGNQVSSTVVA